MKNKLLILMFLVIGTLLLSFTYIEKNSKSENVKHKHNMSFPCHPNGDIYPCAHPVHPIGDLGPCTHFDYYGNRIHWRGDIYPCSHPVHVMGDIGPCTHVCW